MPNQRKNEEGRKVVRGLKERGLRGARTPESNDPPEPEEKKGDCCECCDKQDAPEPSAPPKKNEVIRGLKERGLRGARVTDHDVDNAYGDEGKVLEVLLESAPRDDSHPFKGTVVDSGISIQEGDLLGLQNANPAIGQYLSIVTTIVPVSGSGTIWLKVPLSWDSTDLAQLTDGDLTLFRAYPTGAPTYTTDQPTGGNYWSNDDENFHYYRILEFSTVSGDVLIDKQITRDNIQVSDIKILPGS